MENLPDDPTQRRTLAHALMKSGESLMQRLPEDTGRDPDEVIATFIRAKTILLTDAEAGDPESRPLLAVLLCQLSRARLILQRKGSADGLRDARECLHWLSGEELTSVEHLRVGLTARMSAACHAESASDDEERFLDLTDIAEEALEVATEGRCRFGPAAVESSLLADLIRLGGHGYLHSSPDFLVEFLLDWLDPDATSTPLTETAAYDAALEVLTSGMARIRRKGFADLGSEDHARNEARLVRWQECRDHLSAIRAGATI